MPDLTGIQRASSDLRCNPHFHTVFLDGIYVRDKQGGPPVFHPAPPPSQAQEQMVVKKNAVRIVRLLNRRGLIALATAPGNDEVTLIVADETLGEDDPLLAELVAAATAGLPPAGLAQWRAPLRLALSANAQPVSKRNLHFFLALRQVPVVPWGPKNRNQRQQRWEVRRLRCVFRPLPACVTGRNKRSHFTSSFDKPGRNRRTVRAPQSRCCRPDQLPRSTGRHRHRYAAGHLQCRGRH